MGRSGAEMILLNSQVSAQPFNGETREEIYTQHSEPRNYPKRCYYESTSNSVCRTMKAEFLSQFTLFLLGVFLTTMLNYVNKGVSDFKTGKVSYGLRSFPNDIFLFFICFNVPLYFNYANCSLYYAKL